MQSSRIWILNGTFDRIFLSYYVYCQLLHKIEVGGIHCCVLVLRAMARTQKRGLSQDWEALLNHSPIRSLFRQRFDAVNTSLPVYARLRKFTLLTEPFSQERNELTPTLKVKRHEVLLTRQAEIAAMYPTRNVPHEAQPQAS